MRKIAFTVALSVLCFSSVPASAQFLFGKQPVCTQQYQPVCASRAGMTRTYPNSCIARSNGARVVAQGQCRRMSNAQAPSMALQENGPSMVTEPDRR